MTLRRSTVVVAFLWSPAALALPTVFAVDEPTQTLLRINPSTGVIVEVGPVDLGEDTGDVTDLASDGSRLFVLTSVFPDGAFIGELNAETGGTLSSHRVTVGGVNAINAVEAISIDAAGRLILSLWRPGAASIFNSSNLGVLALTGEVTDIVDMGSLRDFDGLGFDPNGDMVGLNREVGTGFNYVDLHNVSHTPPTSPTIIRIPFSGTFDLVDDCAVLDGEIITIDLEFKRINRHNRASGAISSFTIYPEGHSIFRVTVVDLCGGDADGSGHVDFADLNLVLSAFNTSQQAGAYDGRADRDTDGDVDFGDLNLVLSGFNQPCP